MGLSLISLFTFVFLSFLLFFFHLASSRQSFCHANEHSALLRFKESLAINKSASDDPSAYPKTTHWNLEEDSSDCCSWEGVKCNEDTGYVIELDLSSSCLYGSINSTSTLFNLVHLQWLSIADNDFNDSKIPSAINNLSKLSHLNLSLSVFSGQIPQEFLELVKLESLLLFGNPLQLQQPGLESLAKKLTNLKVLDLGSVNISSSIPHVLTNLSALEFLSLASCGLEGKFLIKVFSVSYLYLKKKNLEYVSNISFRNYSVFIRYCIFSSQDLSSLSNLTHLNRLDLSDNNISSPSSSLSWIGKKTKLAHLDLSGINIGEIPFWLMNLNRLSTLDLSSNNISGHIPEWLFNLSKNSLQNLNLSHNLLTGFDQRPVVLPWANLFFLDLSFNKLPGPLPFSPTSTIQFYLVSNNKLSGEIPLSICKLNSLQALDLSNNNFNGKVPQCLGNFSRDLLMLNLQNNKFSGTTILRGKIPRSLTNCTNLEFLDLGNNKISDTFPSWIGILPNLEELKSDFEFPKLRIIDLSQNRFTGKLPSKYFECWNAMKVVNASKLTYMMKEGSSLNYGYSLTMVNKGIKIEYVKISNMLVYICLSNNRFEGEIPASVSILKGLRYLNLSNNNLIGGIPSSLGSLTVLESLDLSSNNLLGEIPPQLVKLTPLAFFNVSCNHLTGPIPQGAQFDTFSNMSYEGNPGLCGRPLSRKCGDSDLPPNEDDDDEGSESPFAFGWKEVAIGYASGMIFGVVLGYIFLTRKHELFVKIFGMPLKRIERKRGRRRN
ncbi:hypothetical protein ACOSP7_002890 [Xanthoceras sorbifolium]